MQLNLMVIKNFDGDDKDKLLKKTLKITFF